MLTEAFVMKVLANLSAHAIKGCVSLIGGNDESESALKTCVRAGWKELEAAIDPEHRVETTNVFISFFSLEGEWMGEQVAKLMRERRWDLADWKQKCADDIDPQTLQGVTFEEAVQAFERGFFQAAKQNEHFQRWFQSEQTQRQVELLEEKGLVAERDRLLLQYLRSLELDVKDLPFEPIHVTFNAENRETPGVADIYTNLDTKEHRHFDQEREFRNNVELAKESKVVSALEVLQSRQKLILLGDPGSGKSTFVKFVAHCLCRASAVDEKVLGRLAPWEHGALIPVWMELRHVADFLKTKKPSDEGCGLRRYLMEQSLPDRDRAWFCEGLRERLDDPDTPMLILLDGLDEASTEGLKEVVEWINEFVKRHPQHRYVVTCRPYAYVGKSWLLKDFHEATLAPFDEEKIADFVEKWYAQSRTLTPSEREKERDDLIAATKRRDLRGMAERPLLLTVMAQLHASGGRLPDDRTELYQDAVDLLMHRWTEAKKHGRSIVDLLDVPHLKRNELLKGLNQAARRAHAASGHEDEMAAISDALLADCLKPYLGNDTAKAERFVDYIRMEAGLLVPYGIQTYRFPHRSFQEYLAACSWVAESDFARVASEHLKEDVSLWREVFVLAAGQAARSASEGTAVDAVSRVLTLCDVASDREKAIELLDVAAKALCEIGLNIVGIDHQGTKVLKGVQDLLQQEMVQLAVPPRRRNELAEMLSAVGDRRRDVLELEAMRFCYVPGGDAWLNIHSDSAAKDGAFFRGLPTGYWMGQFPVTKKQFSQYLSESGRKARDEDAIKGHPSKPVDWVYWEEARSFCEWLTERWREQGWIPKDWEVRLPTEVEWEKAARGGVEIPLNPQIRSISAGIEKPKNETICVNPDPKRVYPWGDHAEGVDALANCQASQIAETSIVGVFEKGRSPYGCIEMAGNVWEWTLSPWSESYPPDSNELLEPRDEDFTKKGVILKGGAFYQDESGVGCSARVRDSPGGGYDSFGFRVSLSPVPL